MVRIFRREIKRENYSYNTVFSQGRIRLRAMHKQTSTRIAFLKDTCKTSFIMWRHPLTRISYFPIYRYTIKLLLCGSHRQSNLHFPLHLFIKFHVLNLYMINQLDDYRYRPCDQDWRCNRTCSFLLLLGSRIVELPFIVARFVLNSLFDM